MHTDQANGRLYQHGGFKRLRSFQTATIIYDGTVSFCMRFMDRRSRTVDQMVQAARSGRQNIAEGSRTSSTSRKSELRLVSVARASLDELLLDYEDFLRQRHLQMWSKSSQEAREIRRIGMVRRDVALTDAERFGLYSAWIQHKEPDVVANALICLIHQANYLLDRQLAALEREFIQGGGYTEQLFAERLKKRREQEKELSQQLPTCPLCSAPMKRRLARSGRQAGSYFWGCSTYPACRGTRPDQPIERTDS